MFQCTTDKASTAYILILIDEAGFGGYKTCS